MNFTTVEIVLGLIAWVAGSWLALNAWERTVEWVRGTVCPYCGERHR